jgi:hypothetical protein
VRRGAKEKNGVEKKDNINLKVSTEFQINCLQMLEKSTLKAIGGLIDRSTDRSTDRHSFS